MFPAVVQNNAVLSKNTYRKYTKNLETTYDVRFAESSYPN